MSETKLQLGKLRIDGEVNYVIRPEHSISDVLRHLASEDHNPNSWDHLIQLCELLKADSLKVKF